MNRHRIILSIGSNKGNKLENIQNCIELIHNRVAVEVSVSKVYEKPSWGFSSDVFYNVALLIHTEKSPEKILEEIFQVEKQLGRIRTNNPGYQAREIDIDIITCDEQIINSEKLVIPHPRMQDRLFVLRPIEDLPIDFVHPILKKNIKELIKDCSDQSNYKVIGSLDCPINRYGLEQLNNIVIEGNIGAGKTTLATKIAEDFNAKLVLEGFADNPFLPKFYQDQSRYAFPLEMSFLADRYQQLSDDLTQLDLFKKFIVADYYIFKSLIFARVTLAEDEYRLYHKIFEIMYKEIPKPDLYVYLYQNTEQLLQNIKKRGRSYEQEILPEYLDKIN